MTDLESALLKFSLRWRLLAFFAYLPLLITAKREALPFDKKFNFIVSDKKKSYIFERGKIKRGVDRNAYASISLEGKDWLRILSGEINFLTLLMESKLRIPSDKFLILTRLGYILQFLS
jgi:putative sterol carrier protein